MVCQFLSQQFIRSKFTKIEQLAKIGAAGIIGGTLIADLHFCSAYPAQAPRMNAAASRLRAETEIKARRETGSRSRGRVKIGEKAPGG